MDEKSENNPILIADAEGFMEIRNNLSAFYKLISDIDLNGINFIPIGTSSTPFLGGLDGDGYTVRNLKVNSKNSYAGLFGYARNAVFKNIRLEEAEVKTSGQYAGVLAGYLNNCSIDKIEAKKISVSGGNYTGGIAGYVNGGSINKCCMSGSVSGASYSGGLAGGAVYDVSICNSYSSGKVISTVNSRYIGGLLGSTNTITVKNCYSVCSMGSGMGLMYGDSKTIVEGSYYDAQKAGVNINNLYNISKLTTALTRKNFFNNWDFEEIWDIEEGITYPFLRYEKTGGTEAEIKGVTKGMGTEGSPYLIETAEGLECIRNDLAGTYKLIADIDFMHKKFASIGTSAGVFSGIFDGTGYVIKNLQIHGSGDAGLFGRAKNAAIKNLKLENIEINAAGAYSGALACHMENCSVEGISVKELSISGKDYTGGLIGYMHQGSIEKCGVSGNISGNSNVGGLAGQIYEGVNISNSYTVGSVTSISNNSYTAGLIGRADTAVIKNCYSACSLSNGKGLVYVSARTTIENSYYDGQKAGINSNDSYNIFKLTTALTRKSIFKNWDFEEIWDIKEGITYPYLRCEREKGIEAESRGVFKGVGTEEDPYLVETAEGLDCVRCDPQGSYKLIADIDLKNADFISIGLSTFPFKGIFDGNGYAIRNINITGASQYTGLFSYASGAVFRYLYLEGGKITSSEKYTGALAGYLNNCNVENIIVKDIVVSGGDDTGGLAGGISEGTISGCYISGNIAGMQYIGGLGGIVSGKNLQILECAIEGSINGENYVGGIAGQLLGSISNSYVKGNVISAVNSAYTGGLAGISWSATVDNCCSMSQINSNGRGLLYPRSDVMMRNCFFDSDLAHITTPATQARTTEQMLMKETYTGWDMENIWKYEENTYPVLKRTELISKDPFELTVQNPAWSSAVISWQAVSGAEEYELSYKNKTEKVYVPEIYIEDLLPDTEYEFRVLAKVNGIRLYSQALKIRTEKPLSVKGLYCTEKGENSVSLAWTQIEEAESYMITYNGNIVQSETNKCMLTELDVDVPYVVSVKALLQNGDVTTGNIIVVKLYHLAPQTEYAAEFIEKCEGKMWFIDEVENLLNRKGKNINSIKSQQDLATIYAIDFKDRNLSGGMPAAIEEFHQLKYLYPVSNDQADFEM